MSESVVGEPLGGAGLAPAVSAAPERASAPDAGHAQSAGLRPARPRLVAAPAVRDPRVGPSRDTLRRRLLASADIGAALVAIVVLALAAGIGFGTAVVLVALLPAYLAIAK